MPDLDPDSYAHWRSSDIGRLTEGLERRVVLDLIGDQRGKHILDVGCGDGDLAVDLARRGAHVTGIDASEAMIAAARQRARRAGVDIACQVATAQALPFPPARFDIVAAVTILCFVKDAQPVFHEIARVLRPGGDLVIGELGKWNSWAAARRVRGWMGSPLWRAAIFRTPRALQSLSADAKLTVKEVRGAIYYPRWAPAARILAPFDPRIGRITRLGAAFIAVHATKPAATGPASDAIS